jgi:hypothetical protein
MQTAFRKRFFCTPLLVLATAFAALPGCSAGPTEQAAVESGDTAASAQTLTRTVDVDGRAFDIEVRFDAARLPLAERLLAEITLVPHGALLDSELPGLTGVTSVSADYTRTLRAGPPAFAVRVRAADATLASTEMSWSFPASAFAPSRELGVLLAVSELAASTSATSMPIYMRSSASGAGVEPQGFIDDVFGSFKDLVTFHYNIDRAQGCSLVTGGTTAAAIIGKTITFPYGALVAVGMEAQLGLINEGMGKSGTRLSITGPLHPTPGIVYDAKPRGQSQRCFAPTPKPTYKGCHAGQKCCDSDASGCTRCILTSGTCDL